MAVPYGIGRKIELDLEQSKAVVQLLTDQSGKLYQHEGDRYFRRMPKYNNDKESSRE